MNTRGICPVCRRHVAVLKSGRIRWHHARGLLVGWSKPCTGQGQLPLEGEADQP